MRPLIGEGQKRRAPALGALDLAACIWVSLGDDDGAARRALAEKVAYYGHALGPLILDRLGLTRDDFAPIEHAVAAEHPPTSEHTATQPVATEHAARA